MPAAALLVPDLLAPDLLAEGAPQKEAVDEYIARYTAAYNEPVTTFGGYAYDAFHILVDAIEEADSTEPAKVREALERTADYLGVTGVFNMNAEDHLGLDPSAFIMVEIRDGKWAVVDAHAQ